MQLTGIADIKRIPACNQIEVLFTTAGGPCHYRVYEESMKDNFVADVDEPTWGKAGTSTPHLAAMGWQ